ncbi:MAG: 3'(2'),5'-bisphosphate nucleotidase CysQ [Xanthomonadales bacterium]|nr:3'(2'),5'-bisphosphate nucleotidase CysQ [Xanthomonadales bacterium]
MKDLVNKVLDICGVAGSRILEIYDTEFEVETKDDQSPLTQADLASHRVIVDGLRELTPGTPILSEESREIPWAERSQWTEYWLVDPLDGTKEFVKRNGEFTVNVALIRDGWPVLGVVLAPVLGDAYFAAEGLGAFRRSGDEDPEMIRCRFPAHSPVTVAGSRSHAGERLQGFLSRIGTHELVSMGSSLKFCLVADGRADLYVRLGPTSEWDTAAAQAVVEQAGGRVTNTAMQRLRYNAKESLLNPEFLVFGDSERNWAQYLP